MNLNTRPVRDDVSSVGSEHIPMDFPSQHLRFDPQRKPAREDDPLDHHQPGHHQARVICGLAAEVVPDEQAPTAAHEVLEMLGFLVPPSRVCDGLDGASDAPSDAPPCGG